MLFAARRPCELKRADILQGPVHMSGSDSAWIASPSAIANR